MFDNTTLEHHIQKYIVRVLMFQKQARFSELRPPKVDTNLFTYHLNLLVRRAIVDKIEGGYELSQKGIAYVDRVSTEKFTVRTQPKIITMLVVQNSDGHILLQKRTKQPYIGLWTLPNGKVHIDDRTAEVAAIREAFEKLNLSGARPRHVGDCYIRTYDGITVLMSTLAHVFYLKTDDIRATEELIWAQPGRLDLYELAPAVSQVVRRTLRGEERFFAEFEETI
jgi:ADP-ribose pyrophosphatase YjhB (NUDIX family)